ncbi:hypothetical protein HaLaN_21698, partial [Haematococcus lacustris]
AAGSDCSGPAVQSCPRASWRCLVYRTGCLCPSHSAASCTRLWRPQQLILTRTEQCPPLWPQLSPM